MNFLGKIFEEVFKLLKNSKRSDYGLTLTILNELIIFQFNIHCASDNFFLGGVSENDLRLVHPSYQAVKLIFYVSCSLSVIKKAVESASTLINRSDH